MGLYAILAVFIAVGTFTFLVRRPGVDLEATFSARRAEALSRLPAPRPPLGEADLADLPPQVATYIRRSGALGKPPVRAVETVFEAELFQAPGQPGMPGRAVQIDVIDPPRRLFFMPAKMKGLPVKVLHDYSGAEASMQVRIARLANAVDIAGPDLARTETVTFLNDLRVYAPTALIGPAFRWREIAADQVEVTYAPPAAPVVTAVLVFDAAGDLVDFISDDRAALQPDGSLKPMRWTTPLSEVAAFDGRRVATRGAAVWHEPAGPFTYGTFHTVAVTFH